MTDYLNNTAVCFLIILYKPLATAVSQFCVHRMNKSSVFPTQTCTVVSVTLITRMTDKHFSRQKAFGPQDGEQSGVTVERTIDRNNLSILHWRENQQVSRLVFTCAVSPITLKTF